MITHIFLYIIVILLICFHKLMRSYFTQKFRLIEKIIFDKNTTYSCCRTNARKRVLVSHFGLSRRMNAYAETYEIFEYCMNHNNKLLFILLN